jgi:hypothetical protein
VGKFVNFVRVHKGLLSSPFLGDSTMNHLGGERHRGSVSYVTGYSATAQRTGNPAYLEPISGSLQKPIEGVYPYWRFSQPKTKPAILKFNL